MLFKERLILVLYNLVEYFMGLWCGSKIQKHSTFHFLVVIHGISFGKKNVLNSALRGKEPLTCFTFRAKAFGNIFS